MHQQEYRQFSEQEHQTWGKLFRNLQNCRNSQAHPIFAEGIAKLDLTAERIPELSEVNAKLQKLTGWQGIAVEGLEDNASFFSGMAERKFPIGNFIRDAQDINYTPAPDVFHDLYGHLPFFANRAFADFCHDFGVRAARVAESQSAMDLWGRLFWFGAEFPLIETAQGRRIFGGGILSSFGESNYALSDEPEVLEFDIELIIDRPYKIDEFQKTVFVLKAPEQLYGCLTKYEELVRMRLN